MAKDKSDLRAFIYRTYIAVVIASMLAVLTSLINVRLQPINF
jgi:hypothetical protein